MPNDFLCHRPVNTGLVLIFLNACVSFAQTDLVAQPNAHGHLSVSHHLLFSSDSGGATTTDRYHESLLFRSKAVFCPRPSLSIHRTFSLQSLLFCREGMLYSVRNSVDSKCSLTSMLTTRKSAWVRRNAQLNSTSPKLLRYTVYFFFLPAAGWYKRRREFASIYW